jgi:hypothetical protein
VKKGVFEFLNEFTHFNPQFKFLIFYTTHAMIFLSFFQTLGIWSQGSGAAGHMSPMAYFSTFWKIRAED